MLRVERLFHKVWQATKVINVEQLRHGFSACLLPHKLRAFIILILTIPAVVLYATTLHVPADDPTAPHRIFPQVPLRKVASNKLGQLQMDLQSAIAGDGDSQPFPLSQEFLDNNDFDSVPLETFTDPYPVVRDKPSNYIFKEKLMCPELAFEHNIEKSKQFYLDADFELMMKKLNEIEDYARLLRKAKKKFQPTIPEQEQWLRFGGASVWLPQFNVHYMVSRVLFSPSGIANKAYVSFLYVQIFDQKWQELPVGTQLSIPYAERKEMHQINIDGSLMSYENSPELDFKILEFPHILPIRLDYAMEVANGKYYYGPEDPRVILHTNQLGFQEPLIAFNMKDLQLTKRTMFIYLPFSNHLTVLKKRNEPYANIEKNWTPFVSPSHGPQSNQVNFIYTLVPLSVLSCEIDTGICDFLQKGEKKDFDYVGPLRGGTQLVTLPLDKLPPTVKQQIKIPENRQVFLGWARAHLNKCGCGESMYRPNMIVFIEDYDREHDRFYYKIADVSSSFDFGAFVPPWITGKKKIAASDHCQGRNVLIPNSIAYWEVDAFNENEAQQPPVTFTDYMGVTLSAADSDVSIVHLRGLLNYLVKMPSLFDADTVVSSADKFNIRGSDWNNKCAMDASKKYCKDYALRMSPKRLKN
ncbi:uncharacterized protein LODBEIA_P23280 [Lodderomyces beijingensis]|uniref:Beta-mannosyltransferase 7 n=1 Tax=Lodderomyces beijingensis TaxID=1775926 RepID=A0ABP0ZJQ6_9ASCO